MEFGTDCTGCTSFNKKQASSCKTVSDTTLDVVHVTPIKINTISMKVFIIRGAVKYKPDFLGVRVRIRASWDGGILKVGMWGEDTCFSRLGYLVALVSNAMSMHYREVSHE
jgi:hypothetical protein